MHRFLWDLRYARPQAISFDYGISAVFGEDTPTAIEGPFALPGIYSVVLTVDGQQYRAPLVVQLDPRVHTSSADLSALLTFSQSLCAALERADALYLGEKAAHDDLDSLARRLTAGHGDRTLLRTVEKLRDATAGQGDTDPSADQWPHQRDRSRCRVSRPGADACRRTGIRDGIEGVGSGRTRLASESVRDPRS